VVSLRLAAVSSAAVAPGGMTCCGCGSRGFVLHGRLWRRLKDPDVERVLVLRYQCKRCQQVRRVYPAGGGPDRLSAAVKQIIAVLHCAGLSYQNVAAVLRGLSVPVAPWSVGRVVEGWPTGARRPTARLRMRLAPTADGWLRGADGAVRFRLRREADGARWLDAEIAPGPSAPDLHDRLARCGEEFPPETA
jgi:hypothetical protein